MGIAITCRGCGQALQVAADDPRKEVECLWCGTKSPISDRTTPKSARAAAIGAGPPPVTTAPAIAAGKAPTPAMPIVKEKPKSEPSWYEQTPYGLEGPPVTTVPEPPSPTPVAVPSPPRTPSFAEDPDDNGSPYGVSEKLNYRCQECGRVLHGEHVVCPSCGFNHETGAKLERTYEPVAKTWVAGWPLAWRLRLFVASQCLILFMGVLATIITGSLAISIPFWMFLAGLTAFVLGTYDRVELTRSPKGKVVLKHTWRACFMERPTRTLRLSQYDGVAKGKWHEPSFWDWVGFVFLIPFGLIPALVFWYYCIHKEMFFVALTKDHGFPDYTLYRGWDEKLMNELHEAIRVIAFPVT